MGSVAGAVGAIRSIHRRTPVRVLERMENRSIGGVRSNDGDGGGYRPLLKEAYAHRGQGSGRR